MLPLLLSFTAVSPAVDPFQKWECPGFPCFIVNVYESRPYNKISQTCGPVDAHTICQDLHDGKAFTIGNITHHPRSSGHPCEDYWGCHQTACTQGSVKQCQAMCDKLQLLDLYHTTCYNYCANKAQGADC